MFSVYTGMHTSFPPFQFISSPHSFQMTLFLLYRHYLSPLWGCFLSPPTHSLHQVSLSTLNLTCPACFGFECPTLISSPPTLFLCSSLLFLTFIYIERIGSMAVMMDWWIARGHGCLMDALVTQNNAYRIGWFVIVKSSLHWGRTAYITITQNSSHHWYAFGISCFHHATFRSYTTTSKCF